MKISFRTLLFAAMLFVPGSLLGAPQAWNLPLKKIPQVKNGQIAIYQGVTDEKGHGFILDNLSILAPIGVTVLTKDPNDDIRVDLAKWNWDTPEKSASTKGNKKTVFEFRTQGELRIALTSKTPTPYQLLVWVGDDIKPNIPPLLVPMNQKKGLSMTVLLAIGGAALLAVIIAAAMLVRRSR